MGSVYGISCTKCKVLIELDKAGSLVFDALKDASANKGKFNSNYFANTKESKGIFSEKYFNEICAFKNFTEYQIGHLLRAILFILEHKKHDLYMWQDEGFRVLNMSKWREGKLDDIPPGTKLFFYKNEE